MASAHLSARPRPISRSQGESATAAAAYRARCELADERTGQRHDYSRKNGDVLFSGMYAPKNAPSWTQNRAEFWNRVEARENRKDSQLAREFTIALPAELTTDQNRMLVQDFVRENFVRRGYVADVNIHRPHPWSDQRNVHAHVMVTLRKFEGQEWSRNKDHFVNGAPDVAELKRLRDQWEKRHNEALKRYGHDARISMKTYAAQGIDRTPEIHLGKAAAEMERRGIDTERGDQLRQIRVENQARAAKAQQEGRDRPSLPEVKREPPPAPSVPEPVPAMVEVPSACPVASEPKPEAATATPEGKTPGPPTEPGQTMEAANQREAEDQRRQRELAEAQRQREIEQRDRPAEQKPQPQPQQVNPQQEAPPAKSPLQEPAKAPTPELGTVERMRLREAEEQDRKRTASLASNVREIVQAVRQLYTTMREQVAKVFGIDDAARQAPPKSEPVPAKQEPTLKPQPVPEPQRPAEERKPVVAEVARPASTPERDAAERQQAENQRQEQQRASAEAERQTQVKAREELKPERTKEQTATPPREQQQQQQRPAAERQPQASPKANDNRPPAPGQETKRETLKQQLEREARARGDHRPESERQKNPDREKDKPQRSPTTGLVGPALPRPVRRQRDELER